MKQWKGRHEVRSWEHQSFRIKYVLQRKDRRVVSMLSTVHNATDSAQVERNTKIDGSWVQVEVRQPRCIRDYSKRLGEVDSFDQRAASYRVLWQTKKCWKSIFLDMIDVAVVNSALLFFSWRSQNPDALVRPKTELWPGRVSCSVDSPTVWHCVRNSSFPLPPTWGTTTLYPQANFRYSAIPPITVTRPAVPKRGATRSTKDVKRTCTRTTVTVFLFSTRLLWYSLCLSTAPLFVGSHKSFSFFVWVFWAYISAAPMWNASNSIFRI